MLPPQHKLSGPEEFKATIRKGKRAGRSTVVVHVRTLAHSDKIAVTGGPRCGLIVSKAVGNAVTRHRVSRQLRHVLAGLIPEVPWDTTIVLRALPAAANATFEELDQDVRAAYEKCLR